MLVEYMRSMGYKDKEIFSIVNSYPLYKYSEEALLDRIREVFISFTSVGYKDKDVIKMTVKNPSLYGLKKETIENKYNDFISLGYTSEQIIKITVNSSCLSNSINNIKNKINYMVSLGYSRNDFLKMSVSTPTIFDISLDNINNSFKEMEKLGYTKKQIVDMTRSFPKIFVYNVVRISDRFNDLLEFGYSHEEVMRITKVFPTIYGYEKNNIFSKISFLESLGIHDYIVKESMILMQSVELSYARYEFFKSKGIELDINNPSKLFMSNKLFERQYGISKNELLKMYSYKNNKIKIRNNY